MDSSFEDLVQFLEEYRRSPLGRDDAHNKTLNDLIEDLSKRCKEDLKMRNCLQEVIGQMEEECAGIKVKQASYNHRIESMRRIAEKLNFELTTGQFDPTFVVKFDSPEQRSSQRLQTTVPSVQPIKKRSFNEQLHDRLKQLENKSAQLADLS